MKKVIYLLPLLLLPVLLAAGLFEGKVPELLGSAFSQSRAFRLQDQIVSTFVDPAWAPYMKVEMQYNPTYHARVDSMFLYYYDPDFGGWGDPQMKVGYIYNAAGYIENSSAYAMMEGVPFLGFYSTAQYDTQNRLTNFSSYVLNMERRDYELISSMNIVYGAGTTFEVFGWEADEDYPYKHSTFVYDGQGRMIEDNGFMSTDNENWIPDYKTTYTYHPQDTLTGSDFIAYVAHNLAALFMLDSFRFPGKITEEINYQIQDSNWVFQDRSLYTYDDQVRMISEEYQYYSGAWNPEERNQFYYDANSNEDYMISMYYSGGDWLNDERTDYNWMYFTANEDPIQPPVPGLSLKAYPVPFGSEVNLQPSSKAGTPVQIGIYNVRGQLLRELRSEDAQSVRWDGKDLRGQTCPAGIYFARARQGAETTTIRMVKY
ncbi:MAG TPA: T9SS type A sorting domain-containing protein [Candidatus Cloacimonadota bacterium]|nr:T9SS type A sorting domain-containing protein [Candidatus Cloacimonadota bacterium]